MNLHRVEHGYYVHGPSDWGPQRTIFKGGDIVDLDDPFLAPILKGQVYKFAPVPKAEAASLKPSESPSGRLRTAREEWERIRAKRPVKTKAEEAISKAAPKVEGIQAPDVSPKKAPAK